jgi:hypothetical protein
MNPISQISPVTDVETARLVPPGAFAALAEEIISTPSDAGPAQRPVHGHRGHRTRRSLMIGLPVAACLAVAGLMATSLGSPGQRVGPISVGPPKAEAAVLSVTRHGRYLNVIVRNPNADPKRYRAEFAKYHLNISLRLVPASPSIVGTLVYASYPVAHAGEITPITAVGKCWTGGGGAACPVGVRVSLRFHGAATLVFGRAARPGEHYDSTGLVTARGEAMHGLRFVGRTVAAVTAMLAKRGVVARFSFIAGQCQGVLHRTAPGSWYVSGANPWAPGQVVLEVTKTWPAASCTSPPSAVASPTPTPGA